METVNFRLISSANKNVSIQLYLALERGIFIEFTTGINLKKLEQSHRPTIKQHRQQTNFINLKK
jgi:hypothetical protein